MSLALALNNALSGIKVNQQTMAVISHNIANANTQGYSRQVVDLASVVIDGKGAGVRVEDVVRKIDAYLEATINRQTSSVAEADIVNEYLERSQILLSEPGSQSSIDELMSTFFNSLQAMAETPERTSTRAAVIEAAATFARELSDLAYEFEQLRFQADTDIAQAINKINADLSELYTLNESITAARALGTSTAGLEDQRDGVLHDLTKYLDVHTYEKENGAIDIFVGAGLSLLDGVLYQLSYEKIGSVTTLIEDNSINPITLFQVRPNGQQTGQSIDLVSGGISSEITRQFSTGKLAGLLNLRDEIFPEMLDQMDMLANELRDAVNTVHNQGSSYPGTSTLTGTRLVTASDRSAWDGSVRIALLDKNGYPVPSIYPGEDSGFRPLTLELASLYNGSATFGEPDVQSIIDEINTHFGIPQNQLRVGNFQNVQLALLSDRVPGNGTPMVNFDFDIENISGDYGDFWVNNVTVLDDTGADITSLTDTMPSVALDPVNTFITTAGSSLVEVTTTVPHSFQIGDRIQLNDPGVAVDGISGAAFGDYFVIQSITSNSFTVDLGTPAAAGATTAVIGQTAEPPYATVDAGDKTRVFQNGSITATLTGNPVSQYYDVVVNMVVRLPDGTTDSANATYRIQSPQNNIRNDRISATYVPPSETNKLITPSTTQGYLRAILVDEFGNELPRINNEYGNQEGYLKIVSLNSDYVVAIDELDSEQLGLPNDVPPRDGTNRAFSHYFELNNFFQSNDPTITGDTLKNSALNLSVEQRLRSNPSLLSTGNLQRSNQPVDPNARPLYTYERFSGDNSIAQELAAIGITSRAFSAAGGLPDVNLTFTGYAGEMIGYMTSTAIAASVNFENNQILLNGYQERSDAISGVNLDEELANTIIYQNAYTASARVIRVTDELFDALLELF